MELPDADKAGFKRYIIIAIGIILMLLGSSIFYIINKPSTNPIPQSTVESVTFPLYYPSNLPKGYNIDQDSFKTSNQAVLYSLAKKDAPAIVISVQPKPHNFDFEEFHLKRITGSKEVLTLSGKAVIGVIANRTVGSLVTDKSWVLVNAPDKVASKDVEQVIKGLTAAKL